MHLCTHTHTPHFLTWIYPGPNSPNLNFFLLFLVSVSCCVSSCPSRSCEAPELPHKQKLCRMFMQILHVKAKEKTKFPTLVPDNLVDCDNLFRITFFFWKIRACKRRTDVYQKSLGNYTNYFLLFLFINSNFMQDFYGSLCEFPHNNT